MREPGDFGAHDIKADGARQTHRFFEPRFDGPRRSLTVAAARRRFRRRMQNQRTARRRAVRQW
jgi:hypothetical protein